MTATLHIQQQHLDLTFASEAIWREVQPLSSDWQRRLIPDLLQSVFDKLGVEDEVIYTIPQLTLDLGTLSFDDLESQLADRLRKALTKQLSERLAALRNSPLEDKPLPVGQQIDEDHVKSLTDRAEELLLFFLRRGYLPWWSDHSVQRKDLSALTDSFFVRGTTVSHSFLFGGLRRCLQQEEIACRRLCDQLPETWVKQVLQLWYEEMPERKRRKIIALWSATWPEEKRVGDLLPWKLIEDRVPMHERKKWTASLANVILLSPKKMLPASWRFLRQELGLPVASAQHIEKSGSDSEANPNSSSNSMELESFTGEYLEAPEVKHGKSAENQPEPSYSTSAEPLSQDEVIYLQNAGLVLLHPYLPSLFRNLGWIKGDEFTGLPAQAKALALMHYLAFGVRELGVETYYPLNKLLCGLSLTDHIPTESTLSEEEYREADHLLDAVISHWTILGQSSREALQQGFLQREGKLALSQEKWTLEVAQHSIDILLDHLPWGLAWIRYPWMTKPLLVSWT